MKLIATLLAAINCFIYSAESSVVYKEYGFAISPPIATYGPNGMVVSMLLNPNNHFSGNVNVMVQDFNGDIDAYDKLSQSQFKEFKFKIVNMAKEKNVITYEYSGRQGQLDLHWYAKVFKKSNKFYLVTATALNQDWNEQKGALINSVNSFKFE